MSNRFLRFCNEDFAEYRSWFDDTETRRWVAEPDDAWLRHVMDCSTSKAWVVRTNGRLQAILQADWDVNGTAWVNLVVAPPQRGRGVGTEVLRAWLIGDGREFGAVEGFVKPANIASLKCAQRCGFSLVSESPNEEGFLHLKFARNTGGFDSPEQGEMPVRVGVAHNRVGDFSCPPGLQRPNQRSPMMMPTMQS